jgi:two-component system OmpR family response regulator
MTAILVIDDEPAVCSVIKLLLGREGLTVVTCADGQAALDVLPTQDFAAALIDLGLEPVQGRHVIESVRAAKPALPIVVMSGVLVGEADDHLPGLPAEIEGLHRLPKPFKPQSLIELVSSIMTPRRTEVETARAAG